MAPLVTAPNFRDVGGVPADDGRTVREGVLFRSEAISVPDADDGHALDARDIRLVCDLRSDAERAEAPNEWWAARGIILLECDLLGRVPAEHTPWATLAIDPGRAGAVDGMRRLYANLPAATVPFLPAIVAGIADNGGATLIHCTAGKDRTGFVCAVILGALGVGPAEVLDDYLASRDRRTERARQATRLLIRRRLDTLGEDALDALMGVDAAYLAAAMDAIAAAHGSVRGYFLASGVDEGMLGRLRARLLA